MVMRVVSRADPKLGAVTAEARQSLYQYLGQASRLKNSRIPSH